MTRRHVVVRGRVQGVGFRWFVREHARSLDIAGWVRNRADGGVELEVEGSADKVAELMAFVSDGPDGAVVGDVEEMQVSGAAALPLPFTIER